MDNIKELLKQSEEERCALSVEYNKFTNLLVEHADDPSMYARYENELEGLEEKTLANKIECRRLMELDKDSDLS